MHSQSQHHHRHHHHHLFSQKETCKCRDNSIYMCELDYKVTSDADNNPETNLSIKTSINQSAVESVRLNAAKEVKSTRSTGRILHTFMTRIARESILFATAAFGQKGQCLSMMATKQQSMKFEHCCSYVVYTVCKDGLWSGMHY